MNQPNSALSAACDRHSPDRAAERAQLFDQLRAASDTLIDSALPDLELASYMAGSAHLHRLARDHAAIYLYPGTHSSPLEDENSPSNDAAQHKAFNEHRKRLRVHGCQAIGISTEAPGRQSLTILRHEVRQELLSDPEARLADALGLPTFTDASGRPAYHRMVLITRRLVIRRVFGAVEAERSAAEVHEYLWGEGRG